MANRNRNTNNRWDDDRNYNDYRNNDKNRNWEGESRQNTSMHQGSWNNAGGRHEENYGLGDTSQGSANYGHVDQHGGARFYGTGNYGGYFGGSDEESDESRRNEDRRGSEGRKDSYGNRDNRNAGDSRSHNSGNNEKGPRFGNSNIHSRPYGSGNSYGNNYGSGSQKRDNDSYGTTDRGDWRREGSNTYSGYGNNERRGDWDNDRDWWDKTSDEVSSWFGDEDAESRREMDRINGPHSGKGPKGYTRSDEKIKDDVQEKLYHDSFIDASDIEVSVSDGEVTLSGTVDNKQTKRRAEDCADRVSGVKDVSNHLKTNSSSSSFVSSEIGSLNKTKTTGGLSEKDQKLDQSKDLNRTENK